VFFDVERKTRFHVKRRAVISEALGGYSGRARVLFRKSQALILEEPGSYSGRAVLLFRKSQALISEVLGLVSANGWKSQSSPNSGNGTAQGWGVHCEVEG